MTENIQTITKEITTKLLEQECIKWDTFLLLKLEAEKVLTNNFHGWLPVKPNSLFVCKDHIWFGWEFEENVKAEIKFHQNFKNCIEITFLLPHGIYSSLDHMNEESSLPDFSKFLVRYKKFLKN